MDKKTPCVNALRERGVFITPQSVLIALRYFAGAPVLPHAKIGDFSAGV